MIALAHISEPRAVPFALKRFEAFKLSDRTILLDPLAAGSLDEALAEATARWGWDRGDRLGIRELGDAIDRLHVFAVRKKSVGAQVWRGHVPTVQHQRWLDPICVVDLNVVAGVGIGLVGVENELHARRQRLRPEGARR